jgi:hypothetical protein
MSNRSLLDATLNSRGVRTARGGPMTCFQCEEHHRQTWRGPARERNRGASLGRYLGAVNRPALTRVASAGRARRYQYPRRAWSAHTRLPCLPSRPALDRRPVFACPSSVASQSSTSPVAISTMRLAHWLRSRGRLGCWRVETSPDGGRAAFVVPPLKGFRCVVRRSVVRAFRVLIH